jgi:Histidine kinase-, DNA gyrase B-, and HSP90-like ATPase
VKQTIDITPDVSLIQKAGEVNYKIPDAVAELNDNAIDARVPGQKLTIENTLGQKDGQKRMRIADTARGISDEFAPDVLVMGRSVKDKAAIGEFGLGLKTAASFLGKRFEVVTATAEADHALRLVYDEKEFIERGKWEIEMERVDKEFDHGTIVEITDLKVNLYGGVKNSVMERFGKIFKHFIAADDVEILVNGDLVVPHVVDTIADYDTEIDFEVMGKRVFGWASLSPKGTGRGAYGFDLVRHSRVLAEHVKIGFKPGFGTTRLIGELHLDDFPVTNNKMAFRQDTEAWEPMEKLLEERLVDLVRESRRIANPGKNKLTPKDEAEVEEHIDRVNESLKSDDLQADIDRRALDAELADEFSDGPLPFTLPGEDGDVAPEAPGGERKGRGESGDATQPPDVTDLPSVQRHRLNRVKTQLRNLSIEHEVARIGRDNLYKLWDVQGVGAKKKLVVTTNADHPMYEAMQDSFMLWMKHNIVEAVAEFFTESIGRTDAMLLTKSDILKHVSRMELAVSEHDGEDEEESQEVASA